MDRRTNTLIVSANDQLFRQVESLVHALDASAHEANRTEADRTAQRYLKSIRYGNAQPYFQCFQLSYD